MNKVFTPFNLPPRAEALICSPGKTQQQFRDESNANNIVRQFRKTGQLPANTRIPRFDDVSNLPSFQEMHNFVIDAQADFQKIPAKIRKQFDNDPMQFADYIRDPANYDACVKNGFLIPRETLSGEQKQAEEAAKKEEAKPNKAPKKEPQDQ